MADVPRTRNPIDARIRSGHGTRFGLLAVYVILVTVFWHLLVAPPFGIGLGSGASHAITTAASVGVSRQRPIVVDPSTPLRVASPTLPGGSVTGVSNWIHIAPASVHL